MKHYPSPLLNTASFYVRTDEKGVVEDIIEDVGKKLAKDAPEITLSFTKSYAGGNRPALEPRKDRAVPVVSVDSTAAKHPIADIIRLIPTYQNNPEDTRGKGGHIQVLQTIGDGHALSRRMGRGRTQQQGDSPLGVLARATTPA